MGRTAPAASAATGQGWDGIGPGSTATHPPVPCHQLRAPDPVGSGLKGPSEGISCSWAVTTEPVAGRAPAPPRSLRLMAPALARPRPGHPGTDPPPGERDGKPVRAGAEQVPVSRLRQRTRHTRGLLLSRVPVQAGCLLGATAGSGCPHHPVTMVPIQPFIPEGKNVSRKETKTEKGNSLGLSVR